MKTYVVAYLATGLVFLAVDAVWLSAMNRLLYQSLLGPLLLERFRLIPAALFYLIYVFGLVFFAVGPALASGQWSAALLRGAVFGLIAYATYDLTNQATVKGWSAIVSAADMGWGAVASGTAALLGFMITQAVTRFMAN
jgi:uncharacterized membrane protein